MGFANGHVLDNAGGDHNRLGRRGEKVVEAQTREATSAQQQQSRGGFSGRSSALRPPRGCSRAPSVRFLKTAVAVLFFWPRINFFNFQNQFSQWIFGNQPKTDPETGQRTAKTEAKTEAETGQELGAIFQFSKTSFPKPVPEPACASSMHFSIER